MAMNISDKHNKRISIFFYFSVLLLFLFSSILIISILVINQKSLEKRITTLENEIQEQYIKQTELLLDSERMTAETLLSALDLGITGMNAKLDRYITAGTTAAGNRINQTNTPIQETCVVYSNPSAELPKITLTTPIQETRVVYSNPPAELPKITLDSLYTQQAILEKEREAARLFGEKKYAMASAQYAEVAQAQPENMEARFYYLYSLFLNNKLDRGNYRQIKEGLDALERYGFYRVETREILEYIASEEDGLALYEGDSQ
jgi:hypothetical protein